ncbi:Anaerobic sulfite reductase subunit A [Aquicella siphonis]|uniref:Anaerobic sulfite reductase subunit A n=1 Tax=Aquicella siphonis TaxID=254247 RepID=A0A5E4PFX8_9COXI|nr:4Fe-4S dicluster domain-containing protein [Aquicella siphonis]VVC75535.1 Anaerobic sulfite reductase subunit A [Aquicella siphonis]
MNGETSYFLPHDGLQDLIDALGHAGFVCIGPKARDGAIVYEQLDRASELPWGMRDYQSPGQYRLEVTDEKKAFAFSNGAQAIKPVLFRPRETVWKVVRNEEGKLEFKPHQPKEAPLAILGARACDLAAMAVQDKVFLHGKNIDPRYQARRENLFVVAVNCSYSSQNCFCVSAGTGPNVKSAGVCGAAGARQYDILMTEIDGGFAVECGSARGREIMVEMSLEEARSAQCSQAVQNVEHAAAMQVKRIPLDNGYGLRDLLFSNLDHPRWDEVADRCLSCGNCTQVCPTCFCHSESDRQNLDGSCSEHTREWDSCFTAGHSYLNGKIIRDDTRKRYRQWLTHKVGSWFDQFDVSGCVGCGRCISWCPVGIDLTQELAAISGESNEREKT